MLAATLVIVGVQIFFTSFLLSMLGLRRRRDSERLGAARLSGLVGPDDAPVPGRLCTMSHER